MARRDVSSPSRIFSRKRPAWARLLGPVLLGLCLIVTGWGLTTALYLERAPLAGTMTSSAESAPPAPAAVPPAAPSPAVAAPSLAEIEPAAGSTAGSPDTTSPSTQKSDTAVSRTASQETSQESSDTPAAPPIAASAQPRPAPAGRTAAADSYWIEYGVFAHMKAAKRLQRALADHGLTTRIVRTHTPQGRALLRVRSAPLTKDAAHLAMQKAASGFGIAALLHRGSPALAAARYWVQFGAFQHRPYAQRLKSHLDQSGIATVVVSTRESSGKSLYLIRSRPLPDRASAIALGERGERVSHAAYLIGRTHHGSALARSSPHPAHPVARPARAGAGRRA